MTVARTLAACAAVAMLGWAAPAMAQDGATPAEAETVEAAEPGPVESGPVELTMWHHAADTELEGAIVRQIVDDFNVSQDDWRVVLRPGFEGAYGEAVAAAAEGGGLPDILDVEAASVPNWVWAGFLAPAGLSDEAVADLWPAAVGRFAGETWSAGPWVTGLALITRRSTLETFDIRVPTPDEPWTRAELDAALTTIAASGGFAYPLDLGMAWGADWHAHAAAPLLASAGGATDALTSDAARDFAAWWQGLFADGLADGAEQTVRERLGGFIEGRYAITWNGNWSVVAAVEEFGDDVVVLPPPDFGEGAMTATSSWQLAVSATSGNPDGAAAFLTHALQPRYQRLFADGLGVIPASRAAAEGSIYYDAGSAMAGFLDIVETDAMPAADDPGGSFAARAFGEALAAIADGADIDETLATAAEAIAADVEANEGYRIN